MVEVVDLWCVGALFEVVGLLAVGSLPIHGNLHVGAQVFFVLTVLPLLDSIRLPVSLPHVAKFLGCGGMRVVPLFAGIELVTGDIPFVGKVAVLGVVEFAWDVGVPAGFAGLLVVNGLLVDGVLGEREVVGVVGSLWVVVVLAGEAGFLGVGALIVESLLGGVGTL